MLDDPTRPTDPADMPATAAPELGATGSTSAVAGGASADAAADAATTEATADLVPTEPVRSRVRARRTLPRPVTYLIAAIAGAVATAVILFVAGSIGDDASGSSPLLPASGEYASDGLTTGMADAPLTIEIWADYQCPYCGLFTHGIEPTLVRDYAATGKALIRYRDFAFLGQESIDAAVAARCAGRAGSYWQYHDLLFASQSGENQGAFAMGNLVKLAEFAGIDTTTFGGCLADRSIADEVARETEEGRALGVESTPTIRIVGPEGVKVFRGLSPLADLIRGIEDVAAGRIDEETPSPGAGSSDEPASTDPGGAEPSPSGATPSP